MKKLFIFFAMLLLSVSFFSNVQAQFFEAVSDSDTLKYSINLDTTTVTVTGVKGVYGGDLVIPDIVSYGGTS